MEARQAKSPQIDPSKVSTVRMALCMIGYTILFNGV